MSPLCVGCDRSNLPISYPLDRWVHDEQVEEVLVNGGREVWVERRGGGGVQYVGRLEAGVVDVVIERVLAPLGRRLDRASPIVDARLPDGTRVCAVLPPIALDGPCLAFRRFTRREIPLDAFGPAHLHEVMRDVVDARSNVLVIGATSSGNPIVALDTRSDSEQVMRLPRLAVEGLDRLAYRFSQVFDVHGFE